MGARPPRETGIDLWISAAGLALLLFQIMAIVAYPGADNDVALAVEWAGVVGGLGAARATWIVQTARARRNPSGRPDAPAAYLLPGADRLVETRSVVETAAFGSLFAYASRFLVVVPSPVWARLVREHRALDQARLRSLGTPGRLPTASVWPALGSAVLLSLFPPLPVAVHLTRLSRLQPPGVGAARRTRARAVPLVAATTVAVWVSGYISDVSSPWWALPMLAQFAAIAVVYGSVQREHNALIRHMATASPSDDGRCSPPEGVFLQNRSEGSVSGPGAVAG